MTDHQPEGVGYRFDVIRHCAAPPRALPSLPSDMPAERARAIIVSSSQWVIGTTLRYHFLEGAEPQRAVVRAAFAEWKALGIGLTFLEEENPAEAEVRIGFDQADGSWSYVGRDILRFGVQEPTMNFGWDLTANDYGRTTALHEIGHTLGRPHEHQNPLAGIVWDEEAVYQQFGGAPNSWDRDTTFKNIIRKLDASEVEGSPWDRQSIMHYAFPGGLITEPEDARTGISPPGTLSETDKKYVLSWYPDPGPAEPPVLVPFASRALELAPKEQADFLIRPASSRKYTVGTFGGADAVLVLFEKVDGVWRYNCADDDSGKDRSATIEARMYVGREYLVRIRLNYRWGSGHTAVMLW